MRNDTVLFLLLFACLPLAGRVFAAAPPGAQLCEACHGPNGVSVQKTIPTIAGMSAFYLDGQILAYQKGRRYCPEGKTPAEPAGVMCAIAKRLSPAEYSAIDKYFAAQKFTAAKQSWDPKLASAGKQIHDSECARCHTNGGSVADDDAGILAGQWSPYLQQAFQEYQSGNRVMPDQMKPKIDALTTDQVNALIQYYASESPP